MKCTDLTFGIAALQALDLQHMAVPPKLLLLVPPSVKVFRIISFN